MEVEFHVVAWTWRHLIACHVFSHTHALFVTIFLHNPARLLSELPGAKRTAPLPCQAENMEADLEDFLQWREEIEGLSDLA